MTNKIPKKFKLMGHTINVEFDNLLFKDQMQGEARYRLNKIVLQPPTIENPYDKTIILSTFYHELMHFIFQYLSEYELRDNEKLVNNIADLLTQYTLTKEL
jgi:hypothetical protein